MAFQETLRENRRAARNIVLLTALGSGVAIGEGQRASVHGLAAADMIVAFRYVFAASAALLAAAALCLMVMEERTLAGPPETSVIAE